MQEQKESNYGLGFYFAIAVIIAVCSFEIYVFFAWSKGSWIEKVSALLAVLGLYGIAIGFFSKSKALIEIKDVLKELTSPNPAKYIRANAIFCNFISLIAARGCEPKMESDCPNKNLWFLGLILWFAVAIILIVFVILHFFIIAPLTYFPMLIVSSVVAKINCSAGDDFLIFGDKRISIKSIIKGDSVAAKGFILGVPTLAISFIGQIYLIIS